MKPIEKKQLIAKVIEKLVLNGYDITPFIGKPLRYRDWETDRKSTRLNSSHSGESRMPSSA